MQTAGPIIAIVLLLTPPALAFTVYRLLRERRSHRAEVEILNESLSMLSARIQPIIDIDKEIDRLEIDINARLSTIEELRHSYREKRNVYERLVGEIAIFDEKLSFAEMGIYEPHFDFSDSEKYKQEITRIRSEQKEMISRNSAVVCTQKWSLDGSESKGQTMTKRNIKLTLRAFNNECESAIANARWNNVNAMEKRILHAQEKIDALNVSNATFVTKEYVCLKLRELYLTHEYREKLKAEREEKAEAARAAREEQKLIRDMERAQDEESRYQRLLDKAKAEARSIVGPQLDAFNEQICMLEADLAEAHARAERAQALAEKTRSGFVYVISNVGSFGSDVVKIGLTRRLDPEDRIRELGDASVPFLFDIHAIIQSDDAPSLERAIHAEFDNVRVNARNQRKEFFRASIDDVEAAIKRLAPDSPFHRDIEAQDYRETLAKRNEKLRSSDVKTPTEQFPEMV